MTITPSTSSEQPNAGIEVIVTINRKGGTGKSETADVLEAIATIGGRRCQLIDVDDANSGLARRVGRDNVIKIGWDANATQAAAWTTSHANSADTFVFDLGSGIESADLPVLGFLARVWTLLRERGARITIFVVVGTNAPIRNFIDRIEDRFGHIARVAVIFNNQDGSSAFPGELRPGASAHLAHSQPGVQQVRLVRQQLLSAILTAPSPGFARATALMARRAGRFARQPLIRDIFGENPANALDGLAEGGHGGWHYSVTTMTDATDERLAQNEAVGMAERALHDTSLSDGDQLGVLRKYRLACAAWRYGATQTK